MGVMGECKSLEGAEGKEVVEKKYIAQLKKIKTLANQIAVLEFESPKPMLKSEIIEHEQL